MTTDYAGLIKRMEAVIDLDDGYYSDLDELHHAIIAALTTLLRERDEARRRHDDKVRMPDLNGVELLAMSARAKAAEAAVARLRGANTQALNLVQRIEAAELGSRPHAPLPQWIVELRAALASGEPK